MFSIHLHNLEFFAHHGLLESEKEKGNDFIVDCTIEMEEPKNRIAKLKQTIDYVVVYHRIKERMATPTPLLETLVQLILDDIFATQPLAQKATVSIKKMRPPIDNFIGQVGVTLERKREI